eukprot:CAMPEP_0168394984 /NCGR_PEP_ID=MMETSP0228-20121227/19813_1 /TAXON_ID=133427 /ORGANISM="Protoceratium reticulatum, Strain CCCM 535 (=CCMP 1889)" /LENGTH=481 /DNA_ID=CAMNT_0008408409 /DNA_START=49 /DNA_END=1494 /DNA_ORIENTATION=+
MASRGAGLTLCLAALLHVAVALHAYSTSQGRQVPAAAVRADSRHYSCSPPEAYRQAMANFFDLQYHAEISIGGQMVQGIIDTGSFDLVAFSKTCTTCGIAPAYDEKISSSYVRGIRNQTHVYGSGRCVTVDGKDSVQLGCYNTPSLDLWLAMDCKMPLLVEASFNAIVGVGPPGQAEFTARARLDQIAKVEEQFKASGEGMPPEINELRAHVLEEIEDAKVKKTMLQTFGMKTFSTCFGRMPGSAGYMVWNDINRADMPGVKKIKVVGNITWGVFLEGIAFHRPGDQTNRISVGCETGCGAILDTGTSLLGVPTTVYKSIYEAIQTHDWAEDCSDLSRFPDLVLKAGGADLRFPPTSYIGAIEPKKLTDESQRFLRVDSVGRNGGTPCQLLLMDLGEQKTQFGPMFILGMPLFREYYTTFDLGAGRGDRSILLAPADDNCEPQIGNAPKMIRRREEIGMRTVDPAKVRVPDWLRRNMNVIL